jgi:hypothetical protein
VTERQLDLIEELDRLDDSNDEIEAEAEVTDDAA